MNIEESGVLGKSVTYPKTYDSSILIAIPRIFNREIYNIEDDNLPFIGSDVWHAYELSFLTKRGLPIAALLKIVIPCSSKCIVESKSLKLYLNSFNLSRFGDNLSEGIKEVNSIIKTDLEALLECNIEVNIFQEATYIELDNYSKYRPLESSVDSESLDFTEYNETPELLNTKKSDNSYKLWRSELLRSNCKVTHQPDWGTLILATKGDLELVPESLLKYIVSFRNENHFHEEICEMIFKRIVDIMPNCEIMVSCIYTRRGGIDICPIRTTVNSITLNNLTNHKVLTTKLLRQ